MIQCIERMAQHNEFGKQGEEIAKAYLIKKGHHIIEQNWRKGKYEIDLISKDGDCLIFIEVKTRNSSVLEVSDVLSKSKEMSLINAVNNYLESIEESVDCRIDLIVIEKKGSTFAVNHIEDAISQ